MMSLEHMTRDYTREKILAVALELIADHGFAATSTREISERLGFTKAALYYHFRTKDDLLAAIVAPVAEDLRALMEAHTSPRASRRHFVERYVDLVIEHEELIRVLANDPSVRHCRAIQSFAPLREQLVQLLSGSEAPDAAQRARVRATFGAVHAALMHSLPYDDRDAVRAATIAAACGALGLSSRESSARHMAAKPRPEG